MEDLHCDIVSDLLPLYIDGVASGESQKAVAAHLTGCAQCRAKLAELRTVLPAENRGEAAPLKKVKREIQKKRYTGIAIGVLVTLAVAILVFLHLTAPILLPIEEAEIQVVQRDDGALCLETSSPYIVDWEVTQDGEGNYFVTCWTNLWVRLQALDGEWNRPRTNRGYSFEMEQTERVYYCRDDGEDILLYSRRETNEGVQSLPRLTLNYYALLACAGAALCGVLWLIMRKKKAGRGFGYAALFFVSYVVSHLAVMRGRGSTYFLLRDFSGILLLTLLLWGVLLLICKAAARNRANRREKGEKE